MSVAPRQSSLNNPLAFVSRRVNHPIAATKRFSS